MNILTVWGGEIDLEVGDWILVPSGALGTQVAEVLAFTKKGGIRVRKWKHSSAQWAQRSSISPRAVLQGLTATEARKRAGPQSGIQTGKENT